MCMYFREYYVFIDILITFDSCKFEHAFLIVSLCLYCGTGWSSGHPPQHGNSPVAAKSTKPYQRPKPPHKIRVYPGL